MKIKQNKKQKPVYGVVNTKSLYVREGVGKEYNPLRSVPVITENEEVEILDTIKGTDDTDWYHIKMKDDIYGYVKAEYIIKK